MPVSAPYSDGKYTTPSHLFLSSFLMSAGRKTPPSLSGKYGHTHRGLRIRRPPFQQPAHLSEIAKGRRKDGSRSGCLCTLSNNITCFLLNLAHCHRVTSPVLVTPEPVVWLHTSGSFTAATGQTVGVLVALHSLVAIPDVQSIHLLH